MQNYLEPHTRHLREWNTNQVMTQSDGKQQHLGVTIWNDTFLDVMYTDIMKEEIEKLPVDLLCFTHCPELQQHVRRVVRPYLR